MTHFEVRMMGLIKIIAYYEPMEYPILFEYFWTVQYWWVQKDVQLNQLIILCCLSIFEQFNINELGQIEPIDYLVLFEYFPTVQYWWVKTTHWDSHKPRFECVFVAFKELLFQSVKHLSQLFTNNLKPKALS